MNSELHKTLTDFGVKHPQINLSKRRLLITLVHEQLKSADHANKEWSLQKIINVINFQKIVDTGLFDECRLDDQPPSATILKEIYLDIKKETRTIRYYKEMYDDLLDEAVNLKSLKSKSGMNANTYYMTKKGTDYFQNKYTEQNPGKTLPGLEMLGFANKLFSNLSDEDKQKWKDKLLRHEAKCSEKAEQYRGILDPEGLMIEMENRNKGTGSRGGTSRKRHGNDGLHSKTPILPDKPAIFYKRNLEYFQNFDDMDDENIKGNKFRTEEEYTDIEIINAEDLFGKADYSHRVYCIKCCMDQLQVFREEMRTYKLRNDDLTPTKSSKYPLNKTQMLLYRNDCLKMPIEPAKQGRDHYARANQIAPHLSKDIWDSLKQAERKRYLDEWAKSKENYLEIWKDWLDNLDEFNKNEILLGCSSKSGWGQKFHPYMVKDKLFEEEIQGKLEKFWYNCEMKKSLQGDISIKNRSNANASNLAVQLNSTTISQSHNVPSSPIKNMSDAINGVSSFVSDLLGDNNNRKRKGDNETTESFKSKQTKKSQETIFSSDSSDSDSSSDSEEQQPKKQVKKTTHNTSNLNGLLKSLQETESFSKTFKQKDVSISSVEDASKDSDNQLKKLAAVLNGGGDSKKNKNKKEKSIKIKSKIDENQNLKENTKKSKKKQKIPSPEASSSSSSDSDSSDSEEVQQKPKSKVISARKPIVHKKLVQSNNNGTVSFKNDSSSDDSDSSSSDDSVANVQPVKKKKKMAV